jgi:hypothetical protein
MITEGLKALFIMKIGASMLNIRSSIMAIMKIMEIVKQCAAY